MSKHEEVQVDLRASDIRCRQHFGSALDGILEAPAQRAGRVGSWSLDLLSGRLVWSEETCELFGITPAEFAGSFEQFESFVLEEDLTDCRAAYTRVSTSESFMEVEYRIRRPDGAVRWIYERGNVEFDATGTAIGRVGIVMD